MKSRDLPIIIILGPTASGKTELSVRLAARFHGEIINADSRALYREFPILSAAPPSKVKRRVPHHLFGSNSIKEPINLYSYLLAARRCILEIRNRGNIPFAVGGSPLYVNALAYEYKPTKKKVSRPMPYVLPEGTLIIGLKLDKEKLKERAAERFERMLKDGVEKEIKRLTPEFRIIGDKSFPEYFSKRLNLEESKERYVKETTDYFKHQMTWFKRDKNINWIESYADAVKLVREHLKSYT